MVTIDDPQINFTVFFLHNSEYFSNYRSVQISEELLENRLDAGKSCHRNSTGLGHSQSPVTIKRLIANNEQGGAVYTFSVRYSES